MAAARAERRLAAILAADVVGYSRLVEQDEAATLAALKDLRRAVIDPLLAEHQGRIVKLMGDGALVEFASVVDAVACAVVVQRGVADHQAKVPPARRIVFRIGINLGDVVVEGEDLFGDGVNVAARLEQLAEPGGVLVSGTAYDHLKGRLGLPLEFTGEHRLKNIAEPVRAYRVRFDGKARRLGLPLLRRARRRLALPALAALLALVVAAGAGWWFWPGGPTAGGKPGIAVLPFDNLGGDEATGRLADGLAEDIITDLARFRDLDVIARNSTEVYKGKAVDVRQVGEDLGVGYVMEGSIQRQGDQFRVTAQLIDAGTGAHVWSDRWDRSTQDVFAVQSEIAERVAAELGGGLSYAAITASEAQRAKRRPPASLSAYEHYLLAAEAKATASEAVVRKGLEHAETAIALDPNFARAYTVRGWLRFFTTDFGEDYVTTFAQAGADFRKGAELDPLDAEARAAVGFWLSMDGKLPASAADIHAALAISPSDIHVLTAAASTLPYAGEVDEGLAAAEKALRLDPHMPPGLLRGVKDAFFFARAFDRTAEVIERMPDDSRNPFARFLLAASHAFRGRLREAEAAKAVFVAHDGEPSAELWLNQGFIFARQQERDLFVGAFRKLDLPVCLKPDEATKLAAPQRLPECVTS